MRDQNGNVITSRAARAPGITNPVSSLDMEELKARQQNEYQRELQKQVQEQQARKQKEKEELARLEALQDQKIQRDLEDINQRERASLIKEQRAADYGGSQTPAPISARPNLQQQQPHDSRNGASLNGVHSGGYQSVQTGNIRRRDPNAGYTPLEQRDFNQSSSIASTKPFVHQPYSSGTPIIKSAFPTTTLHSSVSEPGLYFSAGGPAGPPNHLLPTIQRPSDFTSVRASHDQFGSRFRETNGVSFAQN